MKDFERPEGTRKSTNQIRGLHTIPSVGKYKREIIATWSDDELMYIDFDTRFEKKNPLFWISAYAGKFNFDKSNKSQI